MSSWRESARSYRYALSTCLVWSGLLILTWAIVIAIALMIFG